MIEISAEIQQIITSEQAWHYKIVPCDKVNDSLKFYISEESENLRDEIEFLFGKVSFVKETEANIKNALTRYYRDRQIGKKIETINNNDVDDFLSRLISEAHLSRSSDIHIEPLKDKCRIRFRIDGRLIEKYRIDSEKYPSLLNKIKVKSNLDIAEKRLPQDGRIDFRTPNYRFDIRVSTLPSIFGEKIVMRLLSNDVSVINIENLGFSDTQLQEYLKSIKKNQGIILISGPTGSGKTTTLYATLRILNTTETNILTIEDPVEYTIEGINQTQLKESIGLSFAKALRTFLRQDPDIIMVGEIRDLETAQIAMRAALTGHLVLSTVHTNSAWGTVCRLVDMGVPAYTIADTLILSVAQRLIRKLCPECKEVDANYKEKLLLTDFKINTGVVYKPIGCSNCHYTGYKGRIALYEILPIDKELKSLIKEEVLDISDYMNKKGILPISNLAIEAVTKGQTSIDEVMPLLLRNE